jgi:hypothetical protein
MADKYRINRTKGRRADRRTCRLDQVTMLTRFIEGRINDETPPAHVDDRRRAPQNADANRLPTRIHRAHPNRNTGPARDVPVVGAAVIEAGGCQTRFIRGPARCRQG